MSKIVDSYIKLQIKSGMANPSPPIGPALGAKGVNIKGFCDLFNNRTKSLKGIDIGTVLPVIVTVYKNKSFDFVVKSPLTSVLLKKIVNFEKGSGDSNKFKVGKVTYKQLLEIAEIKKNDLTSISMDAAVRTIAGTAVSMGLDIDIKE